MRSGSPARRRLTPALLVMAMVAALLPLGQAATAATNTAIQLNGTTQYATLGTNAQLRCSAQFTVEPGSSEPVREPSSAGLGPGLVGCRQR